MLYMPQYKNLYVCLNDTLLTLNINTIIVNFKPSMDESLQELKHNLADSLHIFSNDGLCLNPLLSWHLQREASRKPKVLWPFDRGGENIVKWA